MRVLFLDVDGVLNERFWLNPHQIDEDKVACVARIIRETDAQLILHSGWRFWFNDLMWPQTPEALNLVVILDKYKLHLDGRTPNMATKEILLNQNFDLVKAAEILAWLEKHKNVKNYVILDDLDLHNAVIFQHQVKINSNFGLTDADVAHAIRLLMK